MARLSAAPGAGRENMVATRQTNDSTTLCLAVPIAIALTGCGMEQAPPEETADDPEFTLSQVSGNLYEARTSSHNAAVLVTSGGVILVDPLREDFAQWLKGELAARFGATVEYVIYSHHHPDHAAGGRVFADTAIFVGHENTATRLGGGLPSNAMALDRDGNGTMERSEAGGPYLFNFDSIDADRDGSLSGAEINAGTQPLDVTYTEGMMLTLGGSTVELHHPSAAHSDDMTVVLFPDERAAFAVDFLHARRFPGNLSGNSVDGFVAALETVEALDFDILVTGHGNRGDKTDIATFAAFLRTLEADVSAGIAEGHDRETLQDTILLADYTDWLLYEQRRAGLVGEMYDILSAD